MTVGILQFIRRSLNPSRTSGGSGGGASNTCEKHMNAWKAGAADCLVHKFKLTKDCGFSNCHPQNRAMVGQPAKVTQTTSIMEHGWISVTNCLRQVHQTQHNRDPGKIDGGNTNKIRGIKQIITISGGRGMPNEHSADLVYEKRKDGSEAILITTRKYRSEFVKFILENCVREDAASSSHNTGRPGVKSKPAPKFREDFWIEFQTLSSEDKDLKGHIIKNMCSTFGKYIHKLDNFL